MIKEKTIRILNLYAGIGGNRKLWSGDIEVTAVENVISYYEPLIKPQLCGRHFIWSNFIITNIKGEPQIGTFNRKASKQAQIKYVEGAKERYGFSIRGVSVSNKRQIMRNLVKPSIGLHIFECAFKTKQTQLSSIPRKDKSLAYP